MCSAQAENRLELSDSLLLGHYCWGLHPGAPTRSQCASISPCEPQFKRAQSALKVCMGPVVRAPTELTRAIFFSDVLSLWLALTIRIGWCPHWQGISCALQSHRYGLLCCHFLEGRKAGRKEGWLACAKVCLFTSTSSDTPQCAHPVSPSTHAIPIHVRCVLESWQKKVHCRLFAPAYFDTVAMAFFSVQ